MIYLLTAIGLTPGGSSTGHIYRQTIYRTPAGNIVGAIQAVTHSLVLLKMGKIIARNMLN